MAKLTGTDWWNSGIVKKTVNERSGDLQYMGMCYAPVCIPTLDRYEHLKELIESLQKNPWAQYTDLYIGLDFPPGKKYEEGYEKVKRYLNQGIQGFRDVHIIKQDHNLGATKNTWAILDAVLTQFDRFILLEDDNIVSTDFLEYMDKCLEYFYEDERVNTIGGYTNMLLEEKVNSDHANVFAVHDGNGWGLACWKKNWQKMRAEINRDYFEAAVRDIRKISKIKYKRSLYKLIEYLSVEKEVPFQDSTINIYMQMNDMCKILPTKTKVLNRGWDGTGVNCGINDSYMNQEMQEDHKTFSLKVSSDLLTAKTIRENDMIIRRADDYNINLRKWVTLIMFFIFSPGRVNKLAFKWKQLKNKVLKRNER